MVWPPPEPRGQRSMVTRSVHAHCELLWSGELTSDPSVQRHRRNKQRMDELNNPFILEFPHPIPEPPPPNPHTHPRLRPDVALGQISQQPLRQSFTSHRFYPLKRHGLKKTPVITISPPLSPVSSSPPPTSRFCMKPQIGPWRQHGWCFTTQQNKSMRLPEGGGGCVCVCVCACVRVRVNKWLQKSASSLRVDVNLVWTHEPGHVWSLLPLCSHSRL